MEYTTITIPTDSASELLSLIQNSNDTGNEEWDAHMKIVEKELIKNLNN